MNKTILIVMISLLLIGSIFILNNIPDKAEKNFNVCDETWYNYRFSTSLPNENIPFRNTMSIKYIEECE